MIKFTIDGKPMAWQRARVNHATGAFFETSKQSSFKTLVVMAARVAGVKISVAPICLTLTFYFSRPKKYCSKKYSQMRLVMPKRPDMDNCLKMIGDALNGIAWADDSQICETHVRKFYHEIGLGPRTDVTISEING